MWSREKVEELIKKLYAAPALWDISCREYRDRNRKIDEIQKMAVHFNTNVNEISKKIKSLKTQFGRERKKIADKTKNGANSLSEDNIWFGYRMMKFLMKNDLLKGSRNNLGETYDEENIQDDNDLNTSSPELAEEFENESDFDPLETKPSTSELKITPLTEVPTSFQPITPSLDAEISVSKKRKKTTKSNECLDETYNFMHSIQNNTHIRDEFTVYGENVACRMRGANQSRRALSIAKNKIDNILFQLEMGQFAKEYPFGNSLQSSPVMSSVVFPSPNPSPSPTPSSYQIPQ